FFNRAAMDLLGAQIDLINQAEPYSDLIFLVIPFTVLLHTLTSILQGTGDTRTPMFVLIGVNLLHLTLAYPLIYGFWGFPAWGLTGAAVAVGVAESTALAFLMLARPTRVPFPTPLPRGLPHGTGRNPAPGSGRRNSPPV